MHGRWWACRCCCCYCWRACSAPAWLLACEQDTTEQELQGHVLVALGKLAMHDAALANKVAALFLREVEMAALPVVRNNLLIILTDLCVRYTALVDPVRLLPRAASESVMSAEARVPQPACVLAVSYTSCRHSTRPRIHPHLSWEVLLLQHLPGAETASFESGWSLAGVGVWCVVWCVLRGR